MSWALQKTTIPNLKPAHQTTKTVKPHLTRGGEWKPPRPIYEPSARLAKALSGQQSSDYHRFVLARPVGRALLRSVRQPSTGSIALLAQHRVSGRSIQGRRTHGGGSDILLASAGTSRDSKFGL